MAKKKDKCKHQDRIRVGIAIDQKTNVTESMYRCSQCNEYIYEEIEEE